MQIIEADLKSKDQGVEVSFTALLPSTGWTNVGLKVPQYFTEPNDGIQDVILSATPPSGMVLMVIVPAPVSTVIPKSEWLQGVRIKDVDEKPIMTLRTPVKESSPVGQDMVAIKNAGLERRQAFFGCDLRWWMRPASPSTELGWKN